MKTDVLGRMRTSAARRQELLVEFDKSGLSAKKFAEVTGIKYQTLATWLQKHRRRSVASVQGADTVKWLEAVVEQAQVNGGKSISTLVVEFPGGARTEVCNANQAALAADLLRALAKPC